MRLEPPIPSTEVEKQTVGESQRRSEIRPALDNRFKDIIVQVAAQIRYAMVGRSEFGRIKKTTSPQKEEGRGVNCGHGRICLFVAGWQ